MGWSEKFHPVDNRYEMVSRSAPGHARLKREGIGEIEELTV
jgi:hypothetical protein